MDWNELSKPDSGFLADHAKEIAKKHKPKLTAMEMAKQNYQRFVRLEKTALATRDEVFKLRTDFIEYQNSIMHQLLDIIEALKHRT